MFQTIFPHRIFYPGVAVVDRVECWFFADIYHYLSLIIEGFSLELCQVMMQPGPLFAAAVYCTSSAMMNLTPGATLSLRMDGL